MNEISDKLGDIDRRLSRIEDVLCGALNEEGLVKKVHKLQNAVLRIIIVGSCLITTLFGIEKIFKII